MKVDAIAAKIPRRLTRPAAQAIEAALSEPASLTELAGAAAQAATLLKSLANPDRLLLLCLLVDEERNVSALETLTGIRQPSLSQQLGVLREEGIVDTRRDGKFIFYRIASAPALAVLRILHATFCAPLHVPKSRRVRPANSFEK